MEKKSKTDVVFCKSRSFSVKTWRSQRTYGKIIITSGKNVGFWKSQNSETDVPQTMENYKWILSTKFKCFSCHSLIFLSYSHANTTTTCSSNELKTIISIEPLFMLQKVLLDLNDVCRLAEKTETMICVKKYHYPSFTH